MATPPLVLPSALRVEKDEEGAVLYYDGDLVIEGELLGSFARVEVGGALTVPSVPAETVALCGGRLVVLGDLDGIARAKGDIDVQGTVSGAATSGRDLQVRAAVEGARLFAERDVRASGDLVTHEIVARRNVDLAGAAAGAITAGNYVTIAGSLRGSVEAAGNVSIGGAAHGDAVRAGGRLTFGDAVEVTKITARDVKIGATVVKARSLVATERIVTGAAALAIDVILAPNVEIDPDATGRVTVIESHNARNPTKVKGGFSLTEYEDIVGGAAEFLAERGVEPLHVTGDRYLEEGADREDEPAEDVDDPMSLSVEDLEPVDDGPDEPTGDDEAVYGDLSAALKRAAAAYPTLPVEIGRLQVLLRRRDYGGLREAIPEQWMTLLRRHISEGKSPPAGVAYAMKTAILLVSEVA